MAWLSVGYSNDDLCDKLVANGVLKTGNILQAFRSTDRGDFVPEEDRSLAYLDRPFKKGQIHMSAPHMYATVLDALDLKPGDAFLNIGSGTGYLCCLARCLQGKLGLTHGIEFSATMVSISRDNISRFLTKKGLQDLDSIRIVSGNCFEIDVNRSSKHCKYDKIYIGAGCPDHRKEFFYPLLADGGTLVLPINEKSQMIKITKIAGKIFSSVHISNVHFAPLVETNEDDDDEGENELDATHSIAAEIESVLLQTDPSSLFIHSAPLSSSYVPKIRLPAVVWHPTRVQHHQFPSEFRDVVKLLLLASNQCDYSRPTRSSPKCLCSILPTPIWFHILSYASRDWFLPVKSDLELLQIELLAERRLRDLLQQKLNATEQARRALERERDLYRAVMMRAGSRSTFKFGPSINLEEDFEENGSEEEDFEESESDEEFPQSDDEQIMNENLVEAELPVVQNDVQVVLSSEIVGENTSDQLASSFGSNTTNESSSVSEDMEVEDMSRISFQTESSKGLMSMEEEERDEEGEGEEEEEADLREHFNSDP